MRPAGVGSAVMRPAVVRAVVFDVGETLVDETRIWSEWADHLGLPRLTFLAALGAIIARGGEHREVFELFEPGFDLAAAEASRRAAGNPNLVRPSDLYPDAVPCIRALADAGLRIGIAGNQPAAIEGFLCDLALPVELVASSERWGVEKPSPAFFERMAAEFAMSPGEIAYVGDRLDNDVRPAAAAGMVAVFVRRGPWAWIQAGRAHPAEARLVVDSLAELPAALRSAGAAR